MTFTWDIIDISGYSTGDGVNNTGIQIDQPLRISVSGLKYDSSGIDNNHLAFITGIGRTASGDLLTPVSGVFIWNPDNTQWEVTISVSNTNDFSKHTTGFADWEWNSGSINASTGIECEVSGIETYRNAGGSAWDAISSTDGFVNNADTQHTHAGLGGSTTGAFQLDELSDVAQDGVLGYTDGKILRADGNSYEESYLYIADIPKLADFSGDYVTTSGVLNDLSGDYVDLSGLFTGHTHELDELTDTFISAPISGDALRWNGTHWVDSTIQDLPDYSDLSGDYVDLSGDHVTHKTDTTIHFVESSIDHLNIQNIGNRTHAELDTMSGDYVDLSGVVSTLPPLIEANTTQAEVEAIIDAELVNGQSIDNAVDSLILTHKNLASAHHSKYTDAEVEAVSINNVVEDTTPQLGGNLDCQKKHIDQVGLYTPLQINVGAVVGWYKLGQLTEMGGRVTVICHGTTSYGAQTNNGWAIAQFSEGNADNEFGGSYYCIGQTDPAISFEWIDAGINTMDCYVRLGSYFRGSIQIIEGWGFTLNSTATTKLTDPSGTDLTETWHLWSLAIISGNLTVDNLVTTGNVDGVDVSTLPPLIEANTTQAEVEAIIDAELVNGQSIDNAVDSLILTHKNLASAHHSKYTDAEVEAIIDAELVNGQSIDNAVDSLILTHKNLASAHHSKYTDAEVEAIITAEIVGGQSIDNAIDALINTHNVANNHVDHTTVTITAGTGLSGGGTIAANRTIDCDITQYTDAMAQAVSINNVVEDTTPQLGGSLDMNNKAFTAELVAGENLVNGNLTYLHSDGKMYKTDADAETSADTLIAMATETINSTATGTFLLFGFYTTSGLTAGSPYCISTTAGAIVTLATAQGYATGDIVRIIGYAMSTTKLFFNPDKTFLELK